MVTSITPAQTTTGVAVNGKIIVTFSKTMSAATINTATFTVTAPGAIAVNGTVAFDAASNTATFTPAGILAVNSQFTARVSTGIQDAQGVALANDFVWAFTTGAAADTSAPTMISTSPANAATVTPINRQITVRFSEAMDAETINSQTFTLVGPNNLPVLGTVAYAAVGTSAVFTPASPLADNSTFTATLLSGAKDLAGNALASNLVWAFTTGITADTAAPAVLSTNPADLATGVCLNKSVNASFSKAMDPLTLTTASFVVTGPDLKPIAGTTTYNAATHMATFKPLASLTASTPFTATINNGVRDDAGNALNNNKAWSFATGTQACAPASVALGAATPFGAFGGGAGITNQGIFTVINGDIGTTGASTMMTGFNDMGGDVYTQTPLNVGKVNGTIYTAPPPPGTVARLVIASQAAADAQTAFDKMSPGLLPGGTDPFAGRLGGKTVAPGVYQSASGTFEVTGSDLTLDAQGDADAVWVFQMATTLTVGAPGYPRSIVLINGAQAKNVFWQVGSTAEINAAGGGAMVGTIIASAGVTFSTPGNAALTPLDGRALGLNASVTMVNTVINVPAP